MAPCVRRHREIPRAIACAQVFGGPEGLGFGDREDDVFGAGISDEALQKEVQRVLDPRTRSARGKGEPSDRLWINVAPEAEFDRITHVERLRGDPALHGALAVAVRRHATRNPDVAVARFGRMIAKLAGKALGAS